MIELIMIWDIILLLICVAIVFIVQYYVKNTKLQTIEEIYVSLLSTMKESVIAFTYQRLPDGTYENYYLNMDFELEKQIEELPVNHDGTPVNPSDIIHGRKYEIDDGFAITGIDFPFRCPDGWNYENGKCTLPNICGSEMSEYYRGINYYQFNENIQNYRSELIYHPRLFMDRSVDEVKHCNINELYVGGQELSRLEAPCEPYDVCGDMPSSTIHQYPISVGDVLLPNQYYICEAGRSVLRVCPVNTQFSRIQLSCIQANLCLNETNGTTFPLSDNSYIVCRNGLEATVNCPSTVLRSDVTNELECRNTRCDEGRVFNWVVNDFFNIPTSILFCELTNNVLQTLECDRSVTVQVDDPTVLKNTVYELPELIDRYAAFDIPNYMLDTEARACVPFNFNEAYITKRIVWGSHSRALPHTAYNVFTKSLDFSEEDRPLFYRDALVIKSENGEIVGDSINYSNFVSVDDLRYFELSSEVIRMQGDVDGVHYGLQFKYTSPNGRATVDLRTGMVAGSVQTSDTLFYNAYTQTFSSRGEAHSEVALNALLLNDANFSSDARMFEYEIIEKLDDTYVVAIWSLFGAVLAEVRLHDDVVEEDLKLTHLTLPEIGKLETGTPFTAIVQNIVNAEYTYAHVPLFRRYFDIVTIMEPRLGVDEERLFDVPMNYVYMNPLDVDTLTSDVGVKFRLYKNGA